MYAPASRAVISLSLLEARRSATCPCRCIYPIGVRTVFFEIPPATLAVDLFDEPENVPTSPAEGKNPIEGRQRGHVKHGTRRGRHFSWLRLLSIAHQLADPQAEIAIDHIRHHPPSRARRQVTHVTKGVGAKTRSSRRERLTDGIHPLQTGNIIGDIRREPMVKIATRADRKHSRRSAIMMLGMKNP